MQIVIDISEEDYQEIVEDTSNCGTPFENRVFSAIQNGTVLSEIDNRWKKGYEQLYQEKMDEINKRKNELNISIQTNLIDAMKMCCSHQ